MALCPQRKPPRRRQSDIIDDPGHQGGHTRGEPLLHRPQRFLPPCGFDHDDSSRIDPEMLQARRIKSPPFARCLARLAPEQHGISAHLGGIRNPPQAKPQAERQRRRPIARVAATRRGKNRLHLVQAIAGKPAWAEQTIDITSPQSPARPSRPILIGVSWQAYATAAQFLAGDLPQCGEPLRQRGPRVGSLET